MLSIHIGRVDDMLIDIPNYFDAVFEDAWMDTDLTRRIIKEIDKSTLIHPRVIDSPFLGPITPREISGGAKGLILMAYDDDRIGDYFYGGQFGDNTLPLMWEISKTRDIKLAQINLMEYPEDTNIPVYIENDGITITTPQEYFDFKMSLLLHDRFI